MERSNACTSPRPPAAARIYLADRRSLWPRSRDGQHAGTPAAALREWLTGPKARRADSRTIFVARVLQRVVADYCVTGSAYEESTVPLDQRGAQPGEQDGHPSKPPESAWVLPRRCQTRSTNSVEPLAALQSWRRQSQTQLPRRPPSPPRVGWPISRRTSRRAANAAGVHVAGQLRGSPPFGDVRQRIVTAISGAGQVEDFRPVAAGHGDALPSNRPAVGLLALVGDRRAGPGPPLLSSVKMSSAQIAGSDARYLVSSTKLDPAPGRTPGPRRPSCRFQRPTIRDAARRRRRSGRHVDDLADLLRALVARHVGRS